MGFSFFASFFELSLRLPEKYVFIVVLKADIMQICFLSFSHPSPQRGNLPFLFIALSNLKTSLFLGSLNLFLALLRERILVSGAIGWRWEKWREKVMSPFPWFRTGVEDSWKFCFRLMVISKGKDEKFLPTSAAKWKLEILLAAEIVDLKYVLSKRIHPLYIATAAVVFTFSTWPIYCEDSLQTTIAVKLWNTRKQSLFQQNFLTLSSKHSLDFPQRQQSNGPKEEGLNLKCNWSKNSLNIWAAFPSGLAAQKNLLEKEKWCKKWKGG